jgi:hypothetical protein
MPRDILNEYGPNSPSNQRPRASSGGITQARDVMNYQPPQGPTSIGDRGPGLHENNFGNCGTQQRSNTSTRESGSPGLHGITHPHGEDDMRTGPGGKSRRE